MMNKLLPTLVFIVFLVLKLTGYIDWSWWWITAPLWVGYASVAIALVGALIAYAVILFCERKR